MSTFDRIAALLAGPIGVEAEKITPAATLRDLGIDSLDQVDFALELEAEFAIELDDHQCFDGVASLQQLAEAIDRIKQARAA